MDEPKLSITREAVREALDTYEGELEKAMESTPRGSGQAKNDHDHLIASITQVDSARRVLWLN